MTHPALIEDHEIQEYFRLIREGKSRSKAAEIAAGVKATTMERRIESKGLGDEYMEAVETAIQHRRDLADDRLDAWIDQDNCAPTLRIAWLKRWSDAYRDKTSMEVTGTEGGPVEVKVEHDHTAILRGLVELGIVRPATAFLDNPEAQPVLSPPSTA